MQYNYLLIFFALNLHFVWCVGPLTSRYLNEKLYRSYIPDLSSDETLYIDQPIDHFGNNNGTWKMKYYQNLKFFKPGGPIYIFIGGDFPAVYPYFINKTVFFNLALDTSGAMFHTEHRYYGKSRPYKELNAKTLQYLSSKQALADIAHLLKTLKASDNFKNSKVVVFGGSYAGNLAVWMRKLYPDLVDAALASSAPVLAKKDFFEYLEKVNDDIKQYGTKDCLEKVKNTYKKYIELLSTPQGQEELKREQNICADTDFKNLNNQYFFYSLVTTLYIAETTYGDPESVKQLCSREIKTADKINNSIEKCQVIDFNRSLNYSAGCPWNYQVCTEFGYLQSFTSDKQPFGKFIPLEYYVQYCPILYGKEFDEARMDKGIEETNRFYGGLNPNVTKVIFVNGGMDPWSSLSITKEISEDVPSIVIPDSSHCVDLVPESETDSAEIIKIRQFIHTTLKKWISK